MRHSVRAGDGVVILRINPDDLVYVIDQWQRFSDKDPFPMVSFRMIPEDAGMLAGELLEAAKAAEDAA